VGAGLLGQNILGFADVEYDLPHGVVRLFRPKDCRTSSLAYWAKDVAYSVIPRIAHGAPAEKFTYATLTLNGVRLEALLDTGASTVIKRSSAGRAGVHPDDPGVKALSRTGGIGKGLMMTWSAPFKTVAIGDEEIRNTRLLMSDLQIDEDALLGIDFFISHRVFVANSQDKIYFTYEGGPVFGAEPMALERDASRAGEHKVERTESAEAEPTDAVGFLRRGAARLSRNEPDGALSDFNRAVDLAPTEPRYRFERARLFLAEKKVFEAKADLDEALRLDASYQDALLARADLYFAAHDPEKAVLDLDAASRAASPEDERRLLYARGYERAGKWELSLMQLDQWIKAHPESPEIWSGLMTRCWVRVALDRDMDKALSDCDRAVSKLRSTSAMDGRGLVHFLRHEDQDALVDFNAVLALHPKAGWALYGRSLIERREGQDKAADADRAAAIAAFPDMLREAKRMGLEP
jgi:tetratricopeptide (TPR) repeat protein